MSFWYRLYYQLFRQHYGPSSGEVQLADLKARVEAHNVHFQQSESGCTDPADQSTQPASDSHNTCTVGSDSQQYVTMNVSNNEVIIAIVTPLMRRVHQMIEHSGEIAFLDAAGNMDRQQCRVFIMMTHSPAAGLPLGVFITTRENEETIKFGLLMMKEMTNNNAFFGRGAYGPKVFMTDDCEAERKALRSAYPDSHLLLCSFHILQACWRYLWDHKTGVVKADRPELFRFVKDMLYAETVEMLQANYEVACSSEIVNRYPKVLQYIEKLFERREEWALCYRHNLPLRNNNTNNYVESAVRVLKDSILRRMKAFNIQQLLDFIVNQLESHYERRLIDVANSRFDNVQARFMPSAHNIDVSSIKRTSEHLFEVPSENDANVVYDVDMLARSCTCYVGRDGGPCKHQFAVTETFQIPTLSFAPVRDPGYRRLLYTVATGNNRVPIDWFASLLQSSDMVAEAPQPSPDVDVSVQCPPESQPDAPVAFSATVERFHASCQRIESMYLADPAGLESAMKSFCDSVTAISTSTGLSSALHWFGKFTGGAEAVARGRKMISRKKIPVQPTAVARRKTALGGRSRLYAGRKLKSSLTDGHGYGRRKSQLHLLATCRQTLPPRRAPHSLSAVVSNNESLGGSHSAK